VGREEKGVGREGEHVSLAVGEMDAPDYGRNFISPSLSTAGMPT